MTTNIEEALAFTPPTQEETKKSFRLWQQYFSPVFTGLDNIDASKPTLFVGNHTRYGLLDVPLINRGVYLNTGVYTRGLADRAHYKVPGWRDMFGKVGAVVGSREMCAALMDAGESILVFPGGAREVWKGKASNYKLMWQERLGFVRMAVAHGYSITPFCSVGADEALDVILDGDDIMNSFVGKLLKELGLDKNMPKSDAIVPVTRGIGLSMIPRPERFYFSFGKPIETSSFSGREDDKKLLRRLQGKTADSVNELIKETMVFRSQNQHKDSFARKLLRRM